MTIFSIGTTSMPCAPAALSCSILSQNSSSFSTLCTLLQPLSASGSTVGLFIPGSREMISFSLSLGAFSSTYLLRLAFFTERMRNRTCLASGEGTFARSYCSLSVRPAIAELFPLPLSLRSCNRVEPLLTRSATTSASPMPGAISTEPLIVVISAVTLCCF